MTKTPHAVGVFARGGYTVARARRELLPDALAFRPTLAVILLGTNDRINSHSLSALDAFDAEYRLLLDALPCPAILVAIPPCSEALLYTRHEAGAYGSEAPNARIENANAHLRLLAEERSFPFLPFDFVWLSTEGDGVHLSPERNTALAENVFRLAREHHFNTSRVALIGDSNTVGAHLLPHERYSSKLSALFAHSS